MEKKRKTGKKKSNKGPIIGLILVHLGQRLLIEVV